MFVADGEAAEATANATAEVITPIAISKAADLKFGKFAAGTGGTVVIAPAGTRSATGAVILSSSNVGGAASFNVTGDNNATYAITLPASAVTITHATDTTKTMSVGTFTSNPSGTGTLSASGAQTVGVGGTLTVASAQTTGSYTGTFNVGVEYN
ncbi:MAG: DUF4402 domain-containing protein [Acidobacteria bacterium]|nr:DUF4402 domain-containing protein [Acidobacteriota bacterium]